MLPGWLTALMMTLAEAWSARWDGQIRFLRLQVDCCGPSCRATGSSSLRTSGASCCGLASKSAIAWMISWES